MWKYDCSVRIFNDITKGNAVNAVIEFDEISRTGSIRLKLETSENVSITYEELRNQVEPAFTFNKDNLEFHIKGVSTRMYCNAKEYDGNIEITIENAHGLYEHLQHSGHTFGIEHLSPCD